MFIYWFFPLLHLKHQQNHSIPFEFCFLNRKQWNRKKFTQKNHLIKIIYACNSYSSEIPNLFELFRLLSNVYCLSSAYATKIVFKKNYLNIILIKKEIHFYPLLDLIKFSWIELMEIWKKKNVSSMALISTPFALWSLKRKIWQKL